MFGMNQIFATFILDDKVQSTGVEGIEKKLNELNGISSVNQEAITLI